MKLELLIFAITGFLIYNTYYDGNIVKYVKTNMKYIQMATYGFLGLSLYIFLKKYPSHSKSLFVHANDIIKYMPIDKNTADMISPIFNLSKEQGFFQDNDYISSNEIYHQHQHRNQDTVDRSYYTTEKQQQQRRPTTMKRSVSETKKKYVASNQQWRCAHCNQQLDHTFEVDHIVDLQYGGTNEVSNLVALCRNCHGKKTLSRHL